MPRVRIPGDRDVTATLDTPGDGASGSSVDGTPRSSGDGASGSSGDGDPGSSGEGTPESPDDRPFGSSDSRGDRDAVDACVVACPPHPQDGGRRSDRRLRALADGLLERGLACLRFDYGPWDEGRGERRDAGNALARARERYGRVGLFGYSFGGAVALVAAAGRTDLGAVAALAPVPGLPDGSDAASAIERIAAPTLVVYGERDDTVDWCPVVERARTAGATVESIPADHHFVGGTDRIRAAVVPFFASTL